MWQDGGDVLSEDRTTYTMNEADNVAVVEDIASWHQDLGIHIQGEEKGGFGTAELFVAGRVAMFPQFSVFYNVAPAEFDWDVAHLPVNADQTRTTRVASAGHSVYAGTENTDEAWQWIKFLGSETALLALGGRRSASAVVEGSCRGSQTQ